MTLSELIDQLTMIAEQYPDHDPEVRIAYQPSWPLRGMSLPDLIAALIAFRAAHGLPYGPADVLACACIMRGEASAGAWLLQFMRAWQYACAAQDAESAVQA